jgi:hypothetical protein
MQVRVYAGQDPVTGRDRLRPASLTSRVSSMPARLRSPTPSDLRASDGDCKSSRDHGCWATKIDSKRSRVDYQVLACLEARDGMAARPVVHATRKIRRIHDCYLNARVMLI